jgi:hypothetical protein
MTLEPLAAALDLGRRVHHRSDSTKPLGVVVGLLFHPALLALVRWHTCFRIAWGRCRSLATN